MEHNPLSIEQRRPHSATIASNEVANTSRRRNTALPSSWLSREHSFRGSHGERMRSVFQSAKSTLEQHGMSNGRESPRYLIAEIEEEEADYKLHEGTGLACARHSERTLGLERSEQVLRRGSAMAYNVGHQGTLDSTADARRRRGIDVARKLSGCSSSSQTPDSPADLGTSESEGSPSALLDLTPLSLGECEPLTADPEDCMQSLATDSPGTPPCIPSARRTSHSPCELGHLMQSPTATPPPWQKRILDWLEKVEAAIQPPLDPKKPASNESRLRDKILHRSSIFLLNSRHHAPSRSSSHSETASKAEVESVSSDLYLVPFEEPSCTTQLPSVQSIASLYFSPHPPLQPQPQQPPTPRARASIQLKSIQPAKIPEPVLSSMMSHSKAVSPSAKDRRGQQIKKIWTSIQENIRPKSTLYSSSRKDGPEATPNVICHGAGEALGVASFASTTSPANIQVYRKAHGPPRVRRTRCASYWDEDVLPEFSPGKGRRGK